MGSGAGIAGITTFQRIVRYRSFVSGGHNKLPPSDCMPSLRSHHFPDFLRFWQWRLSAQLLINDWKFWYCCGMLRWRTERCIRSPRSKHSIVSHGTDFPKFVFRALYSWSGAWFPLLTKASRHQASRLLKRIGAASLKKHTPLLTRVYGTPTRCVLTSKGFASCSGRLRSSGADAAEF